MTQPNEDNKGISFNGKDGVDLYTCVVLASGLRMYAKTGLKPNRAWTPTAMLAKASQLTGSTFKRGQFLQAAERLEAIAEDIKRNNPGCVS